MVRPKRYIDSFKYGRKAWARKKVSVNPFDFGKQDMFSSVDDSKRGRAMSSPEGAGRLDDVTFHDDVFALKPKDAWSSDDREGKVWAKDNLKARGMQQMKGRVRSKTTSAS